MRKTVPLTPNTDKQPTGETEHPNDYMRIIVTTSGVIVRYFYERIFLRRLEYVF